MVELPRGPQRSTDWWRSATVNAAAICDMRFPELSYVVPGIIPEGVTLLASRPKLGKSWLLLQIGSAVATGVPALVSSEHPPQGDVLYLALEDNHRRLQWRLRKYHGLSRSAWPVALTIATEWHRIDEGAIEAIDAWCESVHAPRLVMIDTLACVRPPTQARQREYDADYAACQGLQRLAAKRRISIMIAHHQRKMDADDVYDTVSGTLGLTGAVDAIAIFRRTGEGTTLHVRGRDLPDEIEKAIRFNRETCRWTMLGDASTVHRSAERSAVLSALADAPEEGMTAAEIGAVGAAIGSRSRDALRQMLHRMMRDRDVRRTNPGHNPTRYAVSSPPLSQVSQSHDADQPIAGAAKNGRSDSVTGVTGGHDMGEIEL